MGYRVDITSLVSGMADAKLKTMFALETYGKAAAAKLEARAKQDAPWKNRTGLARQTMMGVSDWAASVYRIGIAGNMNYSPYLELARDKQYAVLWPTINNMQAEILRGMRNLI